MSHELRREYLNAIRERYNKSARSKKSLILDEFCSVCGYARKYAIAILNGHVEPCDQKPRGRQVKYTTEVVFHLARLWKDMGMPGSVKLKAALPEWLAYDEHPTLHEEVTLREKILEISRPQIDSHSCCAVLKPTQGANS